MNDLTLSPFMYETVALSGPRATNQLPVSSVCNAECIFCSNQMNPFPIHRIGFRPLADVRKGISLLATDAAEIRLGDSLPGRVSEGEALLHPEILTILRLVRERAPLSTIQINTNGTLLTKETVEKLAPFKPMKLTISYHSDNPAHWQKIFNRGEKHFRIAYESFYHLSMNRFLIEGALVPLPGLVGYADIEQTIKALKAWTRRILIYAPGFSDRAAPELRRLLEVDLLELSAFITEMRKKHGMDLELMPDLAAPLSFAPAPLMRRTVDARKQHVLWVLSEAAYARAVKILEEWNPYFPNEHHAVAARNITYGGNIICSGLLMVSDFREAIVQALAAAEQPKLDLILLPANAFDRFGDDLKGENVASLSEEFGIPVWLENC